MLFIGLHDQLNDLLYIRLSINSPFRNYDILWIHVNILKFWIFLGDYLLRLDLNRAFLFEL